MAVLMSDTPTVRPGDRVLYRWQTGIGSDLSPFKWEERAGTVRDVDRRVDGRQRMKIFGAQGWVSSERIVAVNGVRVGGSEGA